MDRKKRNNKGFSLIELIIGVLILGLIAGPLLHSFVTSANTSNKSRAYRSATLVAQNLTEQAKAQGVDGLLRETKTKAGYTLYQKDEDGNYQALARNAAGDYCYLKEGKEVTLTDQEDAYYIMVEDLDDGRRSYNGLLTLTAGAPTNREEIAIYTAMDAVFVQPPSKEENPDFEAARAMATEARVLSMELDEEGVGRDVSISDFIRSMKRTITIDVENTPGDGGNGGFVSASVMLEYSGTYGGSDPILQSMLGSRTFHFPSDEEPVRSEFFKKYYDTDTQEALHSLYFFYYPSYAGETIILNNNIPDKSQPDTKQSIPFTFFLIKQNVIKEIDGVNVDDYGYGGTTAVSVKDVAYLSKAKLQVWENYDINNLEPLVQVLTNIPDNITTGQPILTGTLSYQVFKGLWYSNKAAVSSLVRTIDENRLYHIKVQLYKDDVAIADMSESNDIISMESSLIQ